MVNRKGIYRIKEAYYEPKAGEWIQPVRKGYKMCCCDCGLVHQLDFRVKDNRAQFRVFRDNRATAAKRREKAKAEERLRKLPELIWPGIKDIYRDE